MSDPVAGREDDRHPAPARRPRLDPLEVRRTLRDAGLRARHGLSQNFLADPDVLEAILEQADPQPGRRILEIGPGLGFLTGGLIDAGAAVVAVELDRGLARFLRDRFVDALARAENDGPDAAGGLRLIEGDALDQDLTRLHPSPYDVVANLPYHITSPILHALLGQPPRPARLVVMVQREVAERIAAPPGRMSYLSVFVQYHARVRVALGVPADAFEPAPAVASSVIVVEPFPEDDRLPDVELEEELWRLVQAGFRERRKMLHNVLVRQLPIPADRVLAALQAAGIAPDRRPQTLAVGEWLQLREALGSIGRDLRGRTAREREEIGSGASRGDTPDDDPGDADASAAGPVPRSP
jgi:16S rRNA (adenine1518-N6/adenine1519-N6)-dimethyltransferase